MNYQYEAKNMFKFYKLLEVEKRPYIVSTLYYFVNNIFSQLTVISGLLSAF